MGVLNLPNAKWPSLNASMLQILEIKELVRYTLD